METSEIIHTIETLHTDARNRNLFFQHATDAELRGRQVTINGRQMTSFGSCSYLGLELHPKLIDGACDATRRYGTQFSCSRGYLSMPLYTELEATFDRIFDAHVLVAPTTTLAHAAAFDALITEKDAIVLDHQVHQSVHHAANLARSHGARVEMVRHEMLEEAIEVVSALAKKYRTVWFCTDGVLSMYGDLAPFGFLRHLLDLAPNVRLYIDDAHGMSWKGKFGRGSFLHHMPLDGRIIVASSLAKAFGCGGGLLIFADERERERVRMCGGTMLFSGPIQPPIIGAALSSAKLHLTEELVELQHALRERVIHCNRTLRAAGLPLLVENDVPIRFIRLGLPRVANEVAERVAKDGIYVNVSMFPTVPMRRAGIRLSINANHGFADIDRLVESLARHIPAVLREEGVTMADLDKLFANAVQSSLHTQSAPRPRRTSSLTVQHVRSIHDLDHAEWDRLLGSVGMISADAMALSEKVFTGQPRREHNWKLDYVIVRASNGKPVAATVFQTALQKDDFIMRDEVSRAVEERRKVDPYFLTSTLVMAGTTLSEGHHMYVDRNGPWQEALRLLNNKAVEIYERERADAIMFRDLPSGDREMDTAMLEEGLLHVPMLDSHILPLTGSTPEQLLKTVKRKRRNSLRQILRKSDQFEVRVYHQTELPAHELQRLWALYHNIRQRKFRINIFAPPDNLLSEMLRSPAWELITLVLKPEAGGPADGRPVAWAVSHVCQGHYGPLIAGLDYDYVLEHGAYRQLLLQVILRAQARGMSVVHLGMDADIEKRRFRTRVVSNCVYMQAREHYQGALMREIVASVGVTAPGLERAPSGG